MLSEVINTGIMAASSAVGSAVGTLIGSLFLRKNTEQEVLDKLKAGKIGEVVGYLLETGKMTYYEFCKCRNFLQIAELADKLLREERTNETIILDKPYSFDWLVRFYEQAGGVSDEGMRSLWAALLAGELSSPNSTNLSLLHALSVMRPEQARYFCNIARYVWIDAKDNIPHLLLFIASNRISYMDSGITAEQTKELERLGLVECDFHREYIFRQKKRFRSGNHIIEIYGNDVNQNRIKAGNAIFTRDGQQLYSIISDESKKYDVEIANFLIGKFAERGYRVVVNGNDRGLF